MASYSDMMQKQRLEETFINKRDRLCLVSNQWNILTHDIIHYCRVWQSIYSPKMLICTYYKTRIYHLKHSYPCEMVKTVHNVAFICGESSLLWAILSFSSWFYPKAFKLSEWGVNRAIFDVFEVNSSTSWPDFTPGGCSSAGSWASHLRTAKKSCQRQLVAKWSLTPWVFIFRNVFIIFL